MRISSYSTLTVAEKCIYTAALLLLAVMVWVQFSTAYVGDKAWLLFATHEILGGKKLYVDIFEVNPPLIYWIFSVPVYLSIHFPFLQDYHYLALMAFVAITTVTALSLWLVKYNPQFASDRKRKAEFCLLLATVFISLCNPDYFFDRENIFLILVFPYLLRWMPSVSDQKIPKSLSIAIGIAGSIGFCIKPHCIAVFICVQLVYFIRKRSTAILFSIENIIICSLAILYLFSILIFTPEYIHTVIPMALVAYDVVNHNEGVVVYFILATMYFCITFVDFRLRYTSPYRKDIFYLVSMLSGFMIYAQLNNGWGYTWHPIISLIFIITGFVWWEYLYLKQEQIKQGLPYKQFLFGARACLINFFIAAFTIMLMLYLAFIEGCGEYMQCPAGKTFVEDIRTLNGGVLPKAFGALSIDCDVWVNLSKDTKSAWVTRFNHIWMLPKFFIAGTEFVQKNHWVLDYVDEAYADDLNSNKPELVFIDDNDSFFSVHKYVDLEEFMLGLPKFRKAWQHYGYVGKIDRVTGPQKNKAHTGYFVYKRID